MMGAAVGVRRFEAALNLLREEGRAVAAMRAAVQADEDLRADDPDHRCRLLVQAAAEAAQIALAVRVLERVEAGELVDITVPPPVPWTPSGRRRANLDGLPRPLVRAPARAQTAGGRV